VCTTEADEIDVAVGGLVRALRLSATLSPDELGKMLGMTFAYMQEHDGDDGHDDAKIGANRLLQVSAALGAPLFPGAKGNAASFPPDLAAAALSLRLLKAFHQIEDAAVREGFVKLIERTAAVL
jgi:hypothetical protein